MSAQRAEAGGEGLAGAEALRAAGVRGLYIFIAPPSEAALEQRLRGRATESRANLDQRLAAASRELVASAAPGLYDLRLVNDELAAGPLVSAGLHLLALVVLAHHRLDVFCVLRAARVCAIRCKRGVSSSMRLRWERLYAYHVTYACTANGTRRAGLPALSAMARSSN